MRLPLISRGALYQESESRACYVAGLHGFPVTAGFSLAHRRSCRPCATAAVQWGEVCTLKLTGICGQDVWSLGVYGSAVVVADLCPVCIWGQSGGSEAGFRVTAVLPFNKVCFLCQHRLPWNVWGGSAVLQSKTARSASLQKSWGIELLLAHTHTHTHHTCPHTPLSLLHSVTLSSSLLSCRSPSLISKRISYYLFSIVNLRSWCLLGFWSYKEWILITIALYMLIVLKV